MTSSKLPGSSFGFICSYEEVKAVHVRPNEEQQAFIDSYRDTYRARFGFDPEGLHYIPGFAPIWLPIAPKVESVPPRITK